MDEWRLAGAIFKCALAVTLARLLATAFNWEFGVSRQYLRLLEWLLDRGRARIERVDSEQRLAHLSGGDSAERRVECEPPGDLALARLPGGASQEAPASTHRRRRVAIANGHFEFGADAGATLGEPAAHREQQQRRRRPSTPDGPPVFLLDDDDDDHDHDYDHDHDHEDQDDDHHNRDQSKDLDAFQRLELNGRAPSAPHKEWAAHTCARQHRQEFHLDDAARFVVRGLEALADDEVTKRFTPEQLDSWNLLTRNKTTKNYHLISGSLGLCWLAGLLARYALLLPLRCLFTLAGALWLVASMAALGLLPERWRARPYRLLSLMSFRMLACGVTSRLRFHERQWRAQQGDICVANHTSPLDAMLLACDNCYALVGQRHAGLLGWLERSLSRGANPHVWFDRAEMRDRQLVTQRLRAHCANKRSLPVLIFPEGTCINNSAVMMFRKGAFETSPRVCPVAIKYDARFGDPFWNSAKHSYAHYLFRLMSSWAIKCDVWYLAPMDRRPGESAAEFAGRVKAEIAKRGGLADLNWDGQLKRSSVKPTWLYQQQEDYARRLKLH